MAHLQDLHDFIALPTDAVTIAEWETYFRRQRVVKVLSPHFPSEKIELSEMIKKADIDLVLTDIAFAILTPVTFFHLTDYMSGFLNATTIFCFTANNKVATEQRTGISGTINYKQAFTAILQRVTGILPLEIIPNIPQTDMLTDKEELALADKAAKFIERENAWMEKYRKLPAVSYAKRYEDDGSIPERHIEIGVKTSFPETTCIDTFTLNLGNEIESPEWGRTGTPSAVYEQWLAGPEIKTWQELYNELVVLSNLYVDVPE